MRRLLPKLVCMLLPLLCATAEAELSTYEISATIYYVYDPDNVLQGNIVTGQTISGTYSFELTAVDEDPSPEYARYNQFNAPGFELVINDQTIRSDNTVPGHMHEIHVGDSVSDYFHVVSWGNTPLNNGAMVSDVNVDLYDPNGTALNNTGLSATAPNVNAFTYKDLSIVGHDSAYRNFNIFAKIDSLKSPAAGNTNPEIITFNVKAIVKDIYDPAGIFNSSVAIGDILDGSYTFNTTIPDDEPLPEIGRYFHRPGSGPYGFDFNLSGYNFKTDNNNVEFVLDLYNGTPSPDHYGAFSYGINKPLPNGATVEDIGLHLYDETGAMLSSTQLNNTPPVLSGNNSYNEIYIWGMHPNGWEMYSIVAEIQEISAAASPSLVALSPASGIFDRAQYFDLAIIFQANVPPIMDRRVYINGVDKTYSLSDCHPGAPNSQNRFTLVCPGYSDRIVPNLPPGKNLLDFHFTLEDGTIVNESVEWEMLDWF